MEEIQFHKTNGPVRIWNNGEWEWRLFGKRHRYYGPCYAHVWRIHGQIVKFTNIS